MLIEIKIANDDMIISVDRVINDVEDRECEGEDHEIKIDDVVMIDCADVIMCEDHFWTMIKNNVIFEAKIN